MSKMLRIPLLLLACVAAAFMNSRELRSWLEGQVGKFEAVIRKAGIVLK